MFRALANAHIHRQCSRQELSHFLTQLPCHLVPPVSIVHKLLRIAECRAPTVDEIRMEFILWVHLLSESQCRSIVLSSHPFAVPTVVQIFVTDIASFLPLHSAGRMCSVNSVIKKWMLSTELTHQTVIIGGSWSAEIFVNAVCRRVLTPSLHYLNPSERSDAEKNLAGILKLVGRNMHLVLGQYLDTAPETRSLLRPYLPMIAHLTVFCGHNAMNVRYDECETLSCCTHILQGIDRMNFPVLENVHLEVCGLLPVALPESWERSRGKVTTLTLQRPLVCSSLLFFAVMLTMPCPG